MSDEDWIPSIPDGFEWEIKDNAGHGCACSFKHKTLPLSALLRFDGCTHIWWEDVQDDETVLVHTDDFPGLVKALQQLLEIKKSNWP